MLRESLDAFNSLLSVGEFKAHVVKLWTPLCNDFTTAAAAGNVAATGGDSFPTFLLRHANRALLTVALDHELAAQLQDIHDTTNRRLLSRSSAAHRRWSVSRSIFLFVFGAQVLTCRNAIIALNNLRLQRGDLDLVDLSQALDRVPIYTTKRSGDVEKSTLNRFRDAMECLCPDVWPKTKPRKRKRTSAEPDDLSEQSSEDATPVPVTNPAAKRARHHTPPLEPPPGTQDAEHHPGRDLESDFESDLESDLEFQSESRLGSSASPKSRSHDYKRLPSEKDIESLPELVQVLPGQDSIPDAAQFHTRSPSPVSSLFSHDSPSQGPGPIRGGSCDGPSPAGPTPLGVETSSGRYRRLLDECASSDGDKDLADMNNVTEPLETGPGLNLSTIVEEEADSGFHHQTAHGIRSRSSPTTGTNPDDTSRSPLPLHPNVAITRQRHHVRPSDQAIPSRGRNLTKVTDLLNSSSMDNSFIFTVKKSKGTSATPATPEQARSRRPSVDESLLDRNDNILPQSPQDLDAIDLTTVATAKATPSPPRTVSSGQSIFIQSNSTGTTNQADDVIDNEAWVSSAQLLAALTIITESSSDFQPGGGNPNWLLIDSLVTERRMRLDDATSAALPQAAACLLPLHVSKNHWMLAILRRDGPGDIEVDLYDSLKSASHTEEAKVQLEDFCSRNLGWSKAACSYVTSISCAQQTNNHDCGVYTVAFAAHVVTRRAIPDEIDTRLWRCILDAMTKLERPPDDVPTARQGLRALFESHYLGQERLALPKCPVPCPEPPASGRYTIIEAQKHAALVQRWSNDIKSHTVERAGELFPAWASTCQRLGRMVLMLRTMSGTAKNALTAVDESVRVKLDAYNRHQLRLAPDDADSGARDGAANQKRDLNRERRRAATLRAYSEIWDFLILVVEDGQRCLDERLSMVPRPAEAYQPRAAGAVEGREKLADDWAIAGHVVRVDVIDRVVIDRTRRMDISQVVNGFT
ncbi:Ulp1 protease family protein [Colletotrichum tofieldiae]|uniref:Ulp1 protease family protein n=1 Tax=Colletotrichum tofieldiae TaxID=708197 RepID=A0A166N172_9PEZI|nr:Ulp1 protease family protein [Colletotrichum tofieldiae]